MIKTCQRCGCQFETSARNVKRCPACRELTMREYQQRYRQAHREKLNEQKRLWRNSKPMTKTDISRLLKALRTAHEAGFAVMTYGGQSFLTDEQLAAVEKKYPDHTQTLRDQREQKFRAAVNNFIKLYRQFGKATS